MKQITVKQLLENHYDFDETEFQLYVVRDHESDLVFYVGQSKRNVFVRMMEHLGEGYKYGGFPSVPDHLGRFILERLPKSNNWFVEFYTPSEIVKPKITKGSTKESWEKFNESIKDWCPFIFEWDESMTKDQYYYDLDEAEQKMIIDMQPCLNVIHNNNPANLPKEYQDGKLYNS